jgi:hypothetical protein
MMPPSDMPLRTIEPSASAAAVVAMNAIRGFTYRTSFRLRAN